jgi:hypothetical protein
MMSVAAGPFHLSHMDLIKYTAMSNQLLMANNLFQMMSFLGWGSGLRLSEVCLLRTKSRSKLMALGAISHQSVAAGPFSSFPYGSNQGYCNVKPTPDSQSVPNSCHLSWDGLERSLALWHQIWADTDGFESIGG